jgi:hypothetical protein
MRAKFIFKTILALSVLIGTTPVWAQSIIFDPNEKELNLPFKYNNGKFEVNFSFSNLDNFEHIRLIAQCEVSLNVKGEQKDTAISVFKSSNSKFAKVLTTINGVKKLEKYPFVVSETISKTSLGSYGTVLEAHQLLGITQVDSLKIFIIDPDVRKIKNLIFVYDQDGEIIDRTVFVDNHWVRCK